MLCILSFTCLCDIFCSILENLRELAENCLGRPMLYELIEVNLTEEKNSLWVVVVNIVKKYVRPSPNAGPLVRQT